MAAAPWIVSDELRSLGCPRLLQEAATVILRRGSNAYLGFSAARGVVAEVTVGGQPGNPCGLGPL
jgi:hypothetical protein